MISYKGFSVKYLKPLDITSAEVKNVRIYYKDSFVYEYSYDKKTGERKIEYNGSYMKIFLNIILRKTKIAPDVATLTADIINFVRRQQFLANIHAKGGVGFIDIFDETGETTAVMSVGNDDPAILDRLVDLYGGTDYKLFTTPKSILC